MPLLESIPALPVRNIQRSVNFYRGLLEMTPIHEEEGFAVLARDAVTLHLWAASDESWRERSGDPPVVSGAESFIAGTASCRIRVEGVDGLYDVLKTRGILHPRAHLQNRAWGDRDFSVVDPDNNLVTFFERKPAS